MEWKWNYNRITGRPYIRANDCPVSVWVRDIDGDPNQWQGRWVVECRDWHDCNVMEYQFHDLDVALDAVPAMVKALASVHAHIERLWEAKESEDD